MKAKFILSILGLGTGVVLAFLLMQTAELKRETHAMKAAFAASLNRPPPPPPTPEEPPIEVADVMTKLQRHANKLYFAGQRKNWKLADFYVEEIEETAKDFSKKNVMHGQVNVSGLMSALLLPEIVELERAVSEADTPAFQTHYKALMTSCNACHTAAKLPFIVIQDPQAPAYDNQRYDLLPNVADQSAPGSNLSAPATALIEPPQPAKP